MSEGETQVEETEEAEETEAQPAEGEPAEGEAPASDEEAPEAGTGDDEDLAWSVATAEAAAANAIDP